MYLKRQPFDEIKASLLFRLKIASMLFSNDYYNNILFISTKWGPFYMKVKGKSTHTHQRVGKWVDPATWYVAVVKETENRIQNTDNR